MAELTGAKINVYSEKTLAIEPGARGVAAIALPLSWYHEGEFTRLFYDGDHKKALGQSIDSVVELRELMKNARAALVWPLSTGGTAATGTLASGVSAIAEKLGEGGNAISVSVAATGELWLVKTFLGTEVVDSQTVRDVAAFLPNGYVKLSGSGSLAAATVSLTEGANGAAGESVWDDFLAALKKEQYQVIAYTGSDDAVKTKISGYVKSEREDEDRFIQAVMGGCEADYEGIISFANGVVMQDGSVLDRNMASAWLAGATARAGITDSLTYGGNERRFVYAGAVDVSPRMLRSEQLAAKNKGLGCFILNNGKVKVESDSNTLVSYTTTKGRDFCKNRVLRVIDAVCGDVKAVFDSSFAGAESNNLEGRNRLKATICDYLAAMQGQGAIENFVADDVKVLAGVDKDTVLVDLHIQPVDAMEKAHVTVWVR